MYLHEYNKSQVKMYLCVCVKHETSLVKMYTDNSAQDTPSNLCHFGQASQEDVLNAHPLSIQHIIANYHFSVFVIVATDEEPYLL